MTFMSSWSSIQAGDQSVGFINADEMILLTDGSVLIHNANTSQTNLASPSAAQWLRLTPDEQGSYDTGNVKWSSPGAMSTAREYFASGMLRDGRVFVIGGEISSDTVNTPPLTPGLDSPLGEIFDPVTNQWSPIAKPATFSYIKGDVPACVLPDGRVLVGGINNPPQTAIWDPAYNTWTAAGTGGAKAARPNEETWTLLPDGSVLTVDVFSAPVGAAERYIPATDEWVPAESPPDQLVLSQIGTIRVNEIGPAVLLPSGTVFAIGATGQTALYDPTSINPWSAGPSFQADTSGSNLNPTWTAIDAPASLLPNGKVVCLAGLTAPVPQPPAAPTGYFSNNLQFFEFDPVNPISPIPLLDKQPGTAANPWPGAGTFTYQCWFLLLPTGQLLCSAGQNLLYLYTPDGAPQPGWAPTITSVPATIMTGGTFTITGTQLSGLSQAVSYGDDGQMATNYPLVQLTSNATNPPTVRYLRTFNFSSMGVAAEGAVSFDVEVPCDLPAGQWGLVVIANGIPSVSVPVEVVLRSTLNPFNFGSSFGPWLHNDTTTNQDDGADDVGDSLQIGRENYLLHYVINQNSSSLSDCSNTTSVENYAEDNAAFLGHNHHNGDGVVGLFGQSDGCSGSIGVGGTAAGWGVAGAATSQPVDVLNKSNSADFTPYPSNVGVFGVGDDFGVYGQNRVSEGQAATWLPSPGKVGVYGVGDVAGVQGDSDHIDVTNGTDVGTGVVGKSIQGIGVLGQGTGGAVSAEAISPYIGVHGLSQANPVLPLPPRQEYLATGVLGVGDVTGVFGVGDVRGGVFKSTPDLAAETFANVQLSPLPLPRQKEVAVQVYAPATQLPKLPAQGRPGDILAVETTDGDGHPSVELWVCIRPPVATGRRKLGASWARIHFDNVVTMPAAG
jgi:hypothetical protein